MTSTIYTVEKVEFTVDGTEYDVSAVSLEASINGIPSCTVGIAPRDKYVTNGSGNNVNAFSLTSLYDTYVQLTKDAEELKSANLMLKLKTGDSTDDEIMSILYGTVPRIELRNWVLASVGLTRVTTVRGFSILCTIMHPAYKLSLHPGFFFTGKGTVTFQKARLEGITDVVDAAGVSLDIVREANDKDPPVKAPENKSVAASVPSNLKSFSDVANDVKDVLRTVKEDLKAIRWDSGKYANAGDNRIPCEYLLSGEGKTAMKYVLANYWAKGMLSSVWSALVGSICPQFGAEVIPEYDKEQLVVGPSMPWTKERVDIPDEFIESMILPGRDPDPLYGVILHDKNTEPPDDPSIVLAMGSVENMYMSLSNACVVPKQSRYSVGTFRACGKPSWLFSAMQYESAVTPDPDKTISLTGNDTYDDDFKEPSKVTSGDNERLKRWNDVVFAHMNSLFMSEYRKGVVSDVSCAFIPNYEGRTLYPGMRIGVKSLGSTLFTGRLMTIRHTIDCTRSVATTNMSLAYCLNGDEDSILGHDPKSPMYAALGDLS